MEPSCLFCLEPVKEQEIQNPIGCPCHLTAHKSCFEQWFVQKQHMECPICHTVSFPHRLTNPEIHVVYINMTQATEARSRWKANEKAVMACFCIFIGWGIGAGILQAVFH